MQSSLQQWVKASRHRVALMAFANNTQLHISLAPTSKDRLAVHDSDLLVRPSAVIGEAGVEVIGIEFLWKIEFGL